MKSITGSILAGFGMLCLVILKVNFGITLFNNFTPFNGSGFWAFIAGVLPVIAIVAGMALIIVGLEEKKQ